MRVFITGATGFIGSAIVREVLDAGHEVVGLARSNAAAAALTSAGATVHRGSLDDPESLRDGATAADGVIHTAFIHDFSDFAANARADELAIDAMAATLASPSAGTSAGIVRTVAGGGTLPATGASSSGKSAVCAKLARDIKAQLTAAA